MVSNQAGESTEFYTYSPFGVAQRYGEGLDSKSFAQGEALGDFLVARRTGVRPGNRSLPLARSHLSSHQSVRIYLGKSRELLGPGWNCRRAEPHDPSYRPGQKSGGLGRRDGVDPVCRWGQFSSVPLTLLGLGFLLASALSRLVVIYYQFSVARGRVTIEDLPGGTGTQALDPKASAETIPVTDLVACSPLGLAGIGLGGDERGGDERGSWWGSGVGLFQLLAAGLLMSWLRRRRGRLAS